MPQADHARRARADVPLIAKIERPQALEHLDAILAAADGVMVARGDLGLECPLEQIPRIQKTIIAARARSGVPVIVATQVLESMRTEPRPTRAEVSDAATAVDQGVDAIMLAGRNGRRRVSGARRSRRSRRSSATRNVVPEPGVRTATGSVPPAASSRHGPRDVRSRRHARVDRAGRSDRRRHAQGKTAQLLSSLRPRAGFSPSRRRRRGPPSGSSLGRHAAGGRGPDPRGARSHAEHGVPTCRRPPWSSSSTSTSISAGRTPTFSTFSVWGSDGHLASSPLRRGC